jgi:hypothetical protein
MVAGRGARQRHWRGKIPQEDKIEACATVYRLRLTGGNISPPEHKDIIPIAAYEGILALSAVQIVVAIPAV